MGKVKQKAIKGISWTSSSSIFNAIIQVLQLTILTWLLSPADFGVIAIVTMVTGFSQIFIDFGVSNAIISKNNVTTSELSSLFWLNIIIGIGLTSILYLVAPFLSLIFNDSNELEQLIRIVSFSLLLKSPSQIFSSLFQKELNFKIIGITDIVSKLLAFLLTIFLAYSGYGAYALAYGNLFYAVSGSAIIIIIGLKIFSPRLVFNYNDLKFYISFGLYQMGDKLLNYFNTQFDTLLIGKMLGMEILGIYNVIKSLINKPYQIINPVLVKITFPLMSRFSRSQKVLNNIYSLTVRSTSYVNFLIYLFFAFWGKSILQSFVSSEWSEYSMIFTVLSLSFLLRSTGSPAGALLLSLGRADKAFQWNLILVFITPFFIYLGAHFDIFGVALSLLVMQILLFVPNWKRNVEKYTGINLIDYLSFFFRPLILSFVSVLLGFIVSRQINYDFMSLVLGLIISSIMYVWMVFLFEDELKIQVKKILNRYSYKNSH